METYSKYVQRAQSNGRKPVSEAQFNVTQTQLRKKKRQGQHGIREQYNNRSYQDDGMQLEDWILIYMLLADEGEVEYIENESNDEPDYQEIKEEFEDIYEKPVSSGYESFSDSSSSYDSGSSDSGSYDSGGGDSGGGD